ncbi:MAG: GNAT family N-acetyltransferase [Agriterribacter sp.]
MHVDIKLVKSDSTHIQPFRTLFLHENNFQFIYDKCHRYGWAESWVCLVDGLEVGYGSIWGSITREIRDAIFEFYITPPFRHLSNAFFIQLCTVSGALFIECQSNDTSLSSMLYQYAKDINAEAILFEDHFESRLAPSNESALFSKRNDKDNRTEDEYIIELDNTVIGGGGLMLNYNLPYADVYMQIQEPFRGKGYGSWLVQELKKEAYRISRVPAARCNINNYISKTTLQKAGFAPCGFILKGSIKK